MDGAAEVQEELPKYRNKMQRVASDTVGQTVVFELIMRLFFIFVLGVRPDSLRNRRRAAASKQKEWFTDGVAASGHVGTFALVLAFRGEIQAQKGEALCTSTSSSGC